LVAHCLWIAIMGIYWLLADYGRSVIRPLIALVASIFVFNASYSVFKSVAELKCAIMDAL
jgi:hypothetical protein